VAGKTVVMSPKTDKANDRDELRKLGKKILKKTGKTLFFFEQEVKVWWEKLL
jgi:hypothetical protein